MGTRPNAARRGAILISLSAEGRRSRRSRGRRSFALNDVCEKREDVTDFAGEVLHKFVIPMVLLAERVFPSLLRRLPVSIHPAGLSNTLRI